MGSIFSIISIAISINIIYNYPGIASSDNIYIYNINGFMWYSVARYTIS